MTDEWVLAKYLLSIGPVPPERRGAPKVDKSDTGKKQGLNSIILHSSTIHID